MTDHLHVLSPFPAVKFAVAWALSLFVDVTACMYNGYTMALGHVHVVDISMAFAWARRPWGTACWPVV